MTVREAGRLGGKIRKEQLESKTGRKGSETQTEPIGPQAPSEPDKIGGHKGGEG